MESGSGRHRKCPTSKSTVRRTAARDLRRWAAFRHCVTRHVCAIGEAKSVASRREEFKMITDEIKQVVKSRYGKLAETGGHKEPC